MTRRTLGDDIEDHFHGTQGVHTGSPANQVGLAQHRRSQARSATGLRRTSPGSAPKSAEENLAALIGLGVAVLIFYAGLTSVALAWYWSLGVAIVGGIGAAKLLLGPLYGLLVVLKWILIGATLLLAGWLVAGLLDGLS